MQFDFKLSPNGGQQIDVVGRFVKYKEGIGKIRVRFNTGAFVDLIPGQGVWGADYTGLTIEDRTGQDNQGILLAGNFAFRDDSITGTVSVVDGGKNSTLSGNCYMGAIKSGAVASNFNVAALENPAGSGRLVVVESIIYSLEQGTTIQFVNSDSPGALMTTTNEGGTGTQSNIVNKRAASGLQGNVATLKGQYRSTWIHPPPFYQARAIAGQNNTVRFTEPVILLPGKTLTIATAAISQEVTVTIEFREDPI